MTIKTAFRLICRVRNEQTTEKKNTAYNVFPLKYRSLTHLTCISFKSGLIGKWQMNTRKIETPQKHTKREL